MLNLIYRLIISVPLETNTLPNHSNQLYLTIKQIKVMSEDKIDDDGGVSEKIELYYVQDVNGNVKNISKTYEDADRFWEKSLKFNGDIKVAIVPKEDWEKEKISTANIKRYKFKDGDGEKKNKA